MSSLPIAEEAQGFEEAVRAGTSMGQDTEPVACVPGANLTGTFTRTGIPTQERTSIEEGCPKNYFSTGER